MVRLAAALVLVAAIAAGLSAFGSTSARAVGPRTLTVTPADGLGNQVVLVHWTGFTPTVMFSHTVTILQCKADPHVVDADRNTKTADDCYTLSPPQGNEVAAKGITQSDGTGSAFIELLPAAQLPMLNCSESTPCSLLAYENDGVPPPTDGLPTTAVTTELHFAKSIDDCPPVNNFDVRAEGEASASSLVFSSAANLCTANPPTILDYTETSSVSGRQDFLGRLVDVGVTSMPPTSGELAAAPGYPQYTYAPIDLTAVVVAYNMNDPTGKRITDLVLSPRLLARVISDTALSGPVSNPDSFWADPELNRLNPGHHWPDQALSQPLLRSEQNADTYFVTDWIAHDANAEEFLQGNDPDGVAVNDAYKNIKYPTDAFLNVESIQNGYQPLQGESPVVRKLFYGVKPAETTVNDPKHVGFIGIVDLPTAMRYGLPIAKLVNAAGKPVTADAAGIAAGYKAMTTNPDGITKAPNYASTDPAAYPLVKVDYAMLPTVARDAAQKASLQRLLAYGATDAQQNLPLGYTALPADLVAQITAAAEKITLAPPTPTTTTTTTTPTTTSSTTAPPPANATPPPVGDLGTPGGGSFDTGSPGTTMPPIATTPVPSTTTRKQRKHAKVTIAKPIVEIATAGERFGLPVIAALALLGGLYPLSRRAHPFFRKAFAGARTRLRRPGRTPPAGSPT